MKEERVSMPMGSAGILGMSSDMKLAGIEIDPRYIVAFALIFVVVVKFASVFIKV